MTARGRTPPSASLANPAYHDNLAATARAASTIVLSASRARRIRTETLTPREAPTASARSRTCLAASSSSVARRLDAFPFARRLAVRKDDPDVRVMR
jgi:hypothetical protein